VPSRVLTALIGALGCLALAVLTYAIAFRTGLGNRADSAVLRHLARFQYGQLRPLFENIALLCNPLPYAVLAGATLVAVFSARGVRTAAIIALVIVGPSLVTAYLKSATATDRVPGSFTPELHVDPMSWPSGHATAASALAFAMLLIVPRASVALVGLAFTLAVSTSVVVLGWHFPSDVIAGYAVAGVFASVGYALLSPLAATAPLARRSLRAPG
jgi:membrane-associated phospholipid phosphatase